MRRVHPASKKNAANDALPAGGNYYNLLNLNGVPNAENITLTSLKNHYRVPLFIAEGLIFRPICGKILV